MMSDSNDGTFCFDFFHLVHQSISNKYILYIYLCVCCLCIPAYLVWKSPGCGTRDVLEDTKGTSGFSEHELLDVMYNACNATNTGAQTCVEFSNTD